MKILIESSSYVIISFANVQLAQAINTCQKWLSEIVFKFKTFSVTAAELKRH
jgi:hypothetical protein